MVVEKEKMMRNRTSFNFELEEELKEEFIAVCRENELTPSSIIRGFMKCYVKKENATIRKVNKEAEKEKNILKKEFQKHIKKANKVKAKVLKAGYKLRGGKEEFVTVRVNKKQWQQFSELAKEEGQFSTRLATNLVLNWLKRPVKIRRWHYRNGTTIRIKLIHSEREEFRRLVESEEIQSSMSRIVDGLIRGWVLTQRRKRNHWNVDPYKL